MFPVGWGVTAQATFSEYGDYEGWVPLDLGIQRDQFIWAFHKVYIAKCMKIPRKSYTLGLYDGCSSTETKWSIKMSLYITFKSLPNEWSVSLLFTFAVLC